MSRNYSYLYSYRMPLFRNDSSDDSTKSRTLSKNDSSEDSIKTGELSSSKSVSEHSLSSLLSRDESFRFNKHAETSFNRLESYFMQKQLTDVVLIAGGTVINAHKIVLCAASDYFAAMFMNNLRESNEKEINFPEMDGDILLKLIHYCYTGKVDLHEDTVESMLATSSILQLKNVIEACCMFLKKQLHPSNCIGICLFADRQSCNELKKASEDYIADNFMDVIQNHEFLVLPEEEVYKLLLSEDLNVPKEEEIFKAVMKWIEYDEPTRSKYAEKLLSLVRLPLLEPSFLVDHVKSKQIFKDNAQCSSIIMEAMIYHMLPERRSLMQNIRTHPRKSTVGDLYSVGGVETSKGCTSIDEFNYRANSWSQVATMNTRRLQFGSAIIDTKIYVIGGRDGLKTLNTAECFDLKTMTWSHLPPMISSRHGLGIAVLGGPLYAVGGHDGWNYLNTVERLDPDLKQWCYVAPMSVARSTAGITVLNNKLYAVGGRDGSSCLRVVEQYDPHINRWSLCSPMIKRRGSVGVGVLNGFLYAVGGNDGSASILSASRFECIERYDPKTDSWTIIANMSVERDSVGVGILGNKLFAIGGYDGQSYLTIVEMYDPVTNEWKQLCPLKTGRAGSCILTAKHNKKE